MQIRRENPVVLLQDPPVPATGLEVRVPRRRKLKNVFVGLMWLVVGGGVITYGSALVYANVAIIEADSAIVSGTLESVRAPAAGRLSIEMKPGTDYARGDNLFSVRNPELEERIGLASVRVARARSDLNLKEAELNAERARRDNFLLSLRADIDRSRAELASFVQLERNAQNRLETTNELYIKGYVTRLRIEDLSDRVAETRANVARARSSEQEKMALAAAVSAGRGYSGVGGLGRMEDFTAAISRADAEVKLAVEEMRVLMERRAEAKVSAAAGGRIIRVLKLNGSSLQAGDSVALLQHDDDRVIYAFLTQAEVGRISIGDEADVFLPAQRLTTRARVAEVERSGAYLDDLENRYGWRSSRDSGARYTDRDRTARVTLRFASSEQGVANRDLDPGTPAVVSFQRRWDGSQMMMAYNTFQQLAERVSAQLVTRAPAASEVVAQSH